jgi:hypothetical protein
MTEEVELPHDDAAHAAMLRGQRLEYLTIGWNVVEFVAATTLGVVAGSIGLLAFGLDTLVELFASIAVARAMPANVPNPGCMHLSRSGRGSFRRAMSRG